MHLKVSPIMTTCSLPPSPARCQTFLLYLFLAIAAVLRLWYLVEVLHAPDYRELRQDMSVQDYQARALLSGDWTLPPDRSDPEIPTTPYYRPPGYTYLLACLYGLSKGSYLAPRLFNVWLGLLAILLTARLARLMFGNAVSLLTTGFMATYWGFIYYEGEVNDPAVFVFLLPCLFLTLRQWGITRSARWAVLAGLITGGYALMRPNILLFGPVMAAWILWLGGRSGQWMRVGYAWLALAGVTALTIAPVTVRNYVVSGELVPISTYFGENLHIGFSDDSDGHTSWTPYLQQLEGSGKFSVWEYARIVRGLGREVGNEQLSHSEASKIFAQKAITWITEHKVAALRLVLKKAALFWSPWEITENKVVHYEKAHSPPLKYLPGFPYLFALFFLGIVMLAYDVWQRRLPGGAAQRGAGVSTTDMVVLLLGFLFTYYISFLPFFVNARARHPMAGLMFLVGAYGVYRMAVIYKEKGLKRILPWALLLAAFYGAGCVDPCNYAPDKARWHYARADSWLRSGALDLAAQEAETLLTEDYSYYMPFRLGHAFALKGNHDLAVRLLRAALSEDPNDQHPAYRQDLYFHIGVSLAASNRDEEARAAFEEALRLNPKDARACNDLGVLLEKNGDFEGALKHYRAALEAQPDFALAASNLADLLGRLGDPENAVKAAEQAVEAAPNVANYHYNLAVQLAGAGSIDRAEAHYRKTLDIKPDEVRALNNLALLLAQQGEKEEAELLFRQALDSAPGYVLARANLGNLLIDLGREEEGIAIYQAGVEMEPENVELLNGLGYQFANLGNDEQARIYYEQALFVNQEYERARANLAHLCVREGRYDEALLHFEQLRQQHPQNARYWLAIGTIHAHQGNRDAAEQAYQQALVIDPQLSEALDHLRILQQQPME